jgi:hypothetical protein
MSYNIIMNTKYKIKCSDCGKEIRYTIDGDYLCEDCSWKKELKWKAIYKEEKVLLYR